jgi:hypothetical protein
MAYARAYSASHRTGRQHMGPLTRATLDILRCVVYDFHNSKSGRCYPGYQSIAAKAGFARSTVGKALAALEVAGVLTWVHRLKRRMFRAPDALTGKIDLQFKVERNSNSYTLKLPPANWVHVDGWWRKPVLAKSENCPGTQLKTSLPSTAPKRGSLEAALASLGSTMVTAG